MLQEILLLELELDTLFKKKKLELLFFINQHAPLLIFDIPFEVMENFNNAVILFV